MSERTVSVLIVDDEPIFSSNMKLLLEDCFKGKFGKIKVTQNFKEAIRLLQKQRFNLIITDMKDQNGKDSGLSVAMHAKISDKECYVIGMSSSYAVRDMFMDAGADDFVDKFVGRTERQAILNKFFRKR